jgi:lysine-specific demethylase 8
LCCSHDANAEEEEEEISEKQPRVVISRASRLRRLAALRSPIATFAAPPTLERFLTSAMAPGAPAVLKGLARAWPALAKWRDPAYLRAVAGARTVPVETGEHYLHETHARELLTLDAFLDEYLSVGYSETEGDDFFDARATTGGDAPAKRRNAAADDADDRVRRRKKKKRKMGYLAQHALLDQIPALRRDVLVPDYCALTLERDDARAENEREGVAIRAWLGPRGTVSPTHRDPTHNLLVQAVGSKYVRLYAPSQERAMYLFSDPKRSNAARADPRDALAEKQARAFPAFSGAPFSDAVLEPGDALYVPPGWFHYVQSVTSSFSVSFWWR